MSGMEQNIGRISYVTRKYASKILIDGIFAVREHDVIFIFLTHQRDLLENLAFTQLIDRLY